MNGNVEMLNYMYQNSEMGVSTLKQLIEITKEESFEKYLNSQLNEYEMINQTCKTHIASRNYDEKEISNVSKISAYLSINIQTLTDKSTSHISEMLIRGSIMGVIDAIKKIKKYDDADEEILDLARKLLKIEENNIEELKNFL